MTTDEEHLRRWKMRDALNKIKDGFKELGYETKDDRTVSNWTAFTVTVDDTKITFHWDSKYKQIEILTRPR